MRKGWGLAGGWIFACAFAWGCDDGGGGGVADVARPDAYLDLDMELRRDVRVEPRDDLGDPCTENRDCRSGFCVLVRGMERVCTRRCGNDQDCPEDWICRQVSNAGVDITFICVPEDAQCAGADLTSDPAHCGECDHPCVYPGAVGVCAESACAMGACNPGFHDLDGRDDNGCEYACSLTREGVEACDEIDNDCDGVTDEGFDLATDLEDCGACRTPCRPANATGACAEGACTIDQCAEGFVDQDGDPENGCEAGCRVSNGGAEACDSIDNDCDGATDEGIDLATDPAHCGGCNRACARANADAECVGGECRFVACRMGFFDRNGDPADGCEVGCQPTNGGVERCDEVDNDCDGATDEGLDLSADPLNCAACGVRCDRPNAMTACVERACRLVGCLDGFFDRNEDPADGCEVGCQPSNGGVEACDGVDNDCDGRADEGFDLASDAANCGVCGRTCARLGADTRCNAGECDLIRCQPGFVDLDRNPANGCEYACGVVNGGLEACNGADDDCDGRFDEGFDLDADAANCGRCGRACLYDNALGLCVDGQCGQGDCTPGFVDANGNPADGCEYACVPSNRGVERCDGEDNDCDTDTDEGFNVLNDAENCGRCGNVCRLANAVPACVTGTCRVANCLGGFVNANGDPGDGCECGLSNGGVEACDGGDNDCDGRADEGFDFQNDPRNCGGCGQRCDRANADTVCRQGGCAITACAPGFVDANGRVADGCEVDCAVAGEGVPECGVEFDYDGTWSIRPPIRYACNDLLIGEEIFSILMNQMTFNQAGAVLSVVGAPAGMTDDNVAGDGTFDATGVRGNAGLDCVERYRLVGQFTDADHWTGTFSVRFEGLLCSFTDCSNFAVVVAGTRVP